MKQPDSGVHSRRNYTDEHRKEAQRILRLNQEDYYGILELSPGAEVAEVRKAYHRLALLLHPDKNSAPGASEAFKLVSKAFSVLSDVNQRNYYDIHHRDPEQRPNAPFADARFQEFDAEEIFRAFFSQGTFANAERVVVSTDARPMLALAIAIVMLGSGLFAILVVLVPFLQLFLFLRRR